MLEDRREEAPFNMALATLERVNGILVQYTVLSTTISDIVTRCYAKFPLVKQLFLSATPLINDDEAKAKLKEEITKLKKEFYSVRSEVRKRNREACYVDTEDKLDSTVQEIQEVLQREKYFMPPKKDARRGWEQK